MEDKEIRLKIFNVEDRLTVAQILVKNGYTVSQGKRQKSTGRSVEYYLKAREEDGNAETVR